MTELVEQPDDEREDGATLAPCPNPYRDGTCRHLTCGRCGQHTNNNTQGHYWKWCHVTKSMRTHHFCCPDDCELEAKEADG